MTSLENVQISRPQHNQLWETVLSALRMAIITGELKPNSHLVEAQLAEKLSVSRGPVREALVRLEQENLVVNYPYRGRFVVGLSLDDIHEVYSLRRLLEGHGVELALEELHAEHLAHLEELLDRMVDLVTDSRFEELVEVDLEFHRLIMTAAGSDRLLQMWEMLTGVSRALIVITASTAPDIVRLVTESHRDILEACMNRDAAAAKEVVHAHLTGAEALMLQAMEDSVYLSAEQEKAVPSGL
jgi:GntR family transcriptional regulator of gluconate operon